MSLFDDVEVKKDCYQVLVVPNITYQKDIDKDSFVKFFSDIVRELNKIRDDLVWHVPLTSFSSLLSDFSNVNQYHLELPTYPNSMRGHFDYKEWSRIVNWKHKDFDFVYSHLPEWTVNISNFLANATHFGKIPIVGYCHWTETKEFAKYAKTYFPYNMMGTLEMSSCGLNTETQIGNILNEAKTYFNTETLQKLDSIMTAQYIGVNEEDIADSICSEPEKVIVFNHRPQAYRNYPMFLSAIRKLREKRQDFTVWCSLSDKKDEDYFDIEGVDSKKQYYEKLHKCCFGVLCGNRWAISTQDGMIQGLPYLYQDGDENRELFSELGAERGKFYNEEQLVDLMNFYLGVPEARNQYAEETLYHVKHNMAWSERIRTHNKMIDKAIGELKSVTDKSQSVKKILTFIDRHGKVSKNEIMKFIKWGVGIDFSPYRQYLRNHPSVELEWDGQIEYYVAI